MPDRQATPQSCQFPTAVTRIRSHSFIIKFAVLMILPVILHLAAFTQSKPVTPAIIGQIKAGVSEAALKTQTITSDFVQEKNMSMIREKIVTKGKFYFKKERMLRWEYLQPFSYIIVIRNDQVSIRDENKVSQFNVQSNKVFQEINRVILGCVRGTLLSDDLNFQPSFSESPSSWVVRLKTLSPKIRESLSEIVIWFDRKDYSVSHLEMFEPGGDCTKINFTDKKINQPVDDEKFLVH